MTLDEFAAQFQTDLRVNANACEAGTFLEDAFTQAMGAWLAEAAETSDLVVCNYHSRGMKVNAYCLGDDDDALDLFVVKYSATVPPPHVTRTEIDTAFRQLQNVFLECIQGKLRSRLEIADPVYDMAETVEKLGQSLHTLRLFLLTDGQAAVETLPDEGIGSCRVEYHVWDITRLYRMQTSAHHEEPVTIDLQEEGNMPIPCLSVSRPADGYEAYLAIFPGTTLARLYDKYGPRLLERNVRAYLLARGKVNKAILQTIRNAPQWFLAYNNGIAATAEGVTLTDGPNGTKLLSSIKDFQIVNGGQTTASIHHAAFHFREDISRIFVQCKLCVVPPEQVENVVPVISRCANTQNRINEADFSANDEFQVTMQELSRRIWAPATPTAPQSTHWFYERARGQYADEVARQTTPARKASFVETNPRSQVITKTDLAKFVNTWKLQPHIVSRGAEKNFASFRVGLTQQADNFHVNEEYFRQTVAKAIIFKRAEQIVAGLNFGGYRANIVTYTLAYIYSRAREQIGLEQIWRKQAISEGLEKAITATAKKVFECITNTPPGVTNVTEWCKKEECWKTVRNMDSFFDAEHRGFQTDSTGQIAKGEKALGRLDGDSMMMLSGLSATEWYTLAEWSKETGQLGPEDRLLAQVLGNHVRDGKPLTTRQAEEARAVLARAQRLGFSMPNAKDPEDMKDVTNPYGDR